MKIRKVTALCFSATGNTGRIVRSISKTASELLGVPEDSKDITLPAAREHVYSFDPDVLVIAGSPVYAGKLPNKILPFWKEQVRGSQTPVIPIVTFGNRSFDNGLAELTEVLRTDGFLPVAAGAFVMPHVFSDHIAADRPDASDQNLMEELIRLTLLRLNTSEDNLLSALPSSMIPGNADAPYYRPLGADMKPAVFLKAKPETKDSCNLCGICANVCPMGSVSTDNPAIITGVCIKCQACIRKCPAHAKYFDDPAFLSHVAMLETHYSQRAESVIF